MKRIRSIAAAPFRAVGWLLFKLVRMLRGLGRPLRAPFVALAGLRGRSRVIAYGAIGVALVAAVLIAKPGPSEEEQVRETLSRYAEANREKDYQLLCDELYATELIQRVRNAGYPCEVTMRIGLESVQNPTLQVLRVEVNGDDALARARSTAMAQVPSVDTVHLVKEDGEWRIASLVNGVSTNAGP